MEAALCEQIRGWFPAPHGIQAIRATFGDLVVANDRIVAPEGWEAYNMIPTPLPGYSKPVYVNKHVIPMLVEALRQCLALGDGYQLKTIGCFAPRQKRSSNAMSTHSWGIAVDINADDNPPLYIRGTADLARRKKTIPDAWVAVFKSIGLVWGGDFSSYYDPMHFQWCSGF